MNKRIPELLLYVLLFLLPFQTRYFLVTGELGGLFYEYGSVSVYLWEMVLVFLCGLVLWEAIRQKKKVFTQSVRFVCGVFVVALFWSWFALDPLISVRHVVFLWEAFCVGWVASRVSWRPVWVLRVLFVSVCLQTLMGLFQFFVGGSPASTWLGIAFRDAQHLGDSVVMQGGGRYLRAYGLMPHPNVLGGFLVIVLVFVLKLFPLIPKKEEKWVAWVLGITTVGLFFTFSRAAWMAAAVGIYLVWKKRPEVRNLLWRYVLVPFVILGCLFSSFLLSRVEVDTRLEKQSVQERLSAWPQALQVWKAHWFLGTGLGNYTRGVWEENSLFAVWEYQPLHMVWVLMVIECGVVLSLLFGFLWFRFFLSGQSGEVLVPLLVLGLFDHYLWTIPFFFVYIILIFSLKSPIKT